MDTRRKPRNEPSRLGAAMWGGKAKPPNRWCWRKAPRTVRGTVPTDEPLADLRERIKDESRAALALI